MNRPNILFVLTDDQRFDTIRALGNSKIITPNIDKLVENGTTFTYAHIPGGTVPAVCMPSRAMINTGRTLFHIEDSGRSVPCEHALLGETLKNNGYESIGIGKWHQGREAFSRSFSSGGEIFFGGMSDHWNVPVYNYDPTGKYSTTLRVTVSPGNSNKTKERECDHINCGRHSSEVFVDCAIENIKKRNKNKPFYMYLSFLAPHDPRTMPDKFKEMYDPNKITLTDNFMSKYPFRYGVENIRCESLVQYPREAEEIKQNIADYYGMVSHLDEQLGRLMETLKEQGIYDNTIIVFAGDNGLAIGQHALMGKHSCYDNSVRVPLIFAGPGIPKNKRTEEFVYLFDIFPTLCELSGCSIPDSVEGMSLVDCMKNDTHTRDELYFAYGGATRGIRDKRYKLIEYRYNGMQKRQLFDMEKDRFEVNDLSKDNSTQEIQKKLSAKLLEYAQEWGDTIHPIGKKFWENY